MRSNKNSNQGIEKKMVVKSYKKNNKINNQVSKVEKLMVKVINSTLALIVGSILINYYAKALKYKNFSPRRQKPLKK